MNRASLLTCAFALILCSPSVSACSGCGSNGNGDEDGDADDTVTDDTSGPDTPTDTPTDDGGGGDGIAWSRTWGGTSDENAQSIIELAGGGFVVAGETDSFGEGSKDFWVVRLAADGVATQERTFGGAQRDEAKSVVEAPGGGYVVAGTTESFGVGADGAMWVIKFDGDGSVDWQRTIAGGSAESIAPAGGGGYFVAGSTSAWGEGGTDAWVVKLDADGTVVWENAYGSAENDMAYDVVATPDDGCAVAGWMSSPLGTFSDAWVLKLDTDGNADWSRTYGGDAGEDLRTISTTDDGGYIVGGSTLTSGAGEADMWILKLDSAGDVDWQNTYGGTFPDRAFGIRQTSDGGYLLAGRTQSFGAGNADMWILKLQSGGDVDWQRTFGSTYDEQARAVLESSDGFYMIAGSDAYYGNSGMDFWVVKLDTDGNISDACPADMINSPSASPSMTSETPEDVSVTPAATTATASDTSCSPSDTDAQPNEQCRS